MPRTIDHDDRCQALDEALTKLQEVRELLDAAGLLSDPAFRAYHAATLEGRDGGWLGGPFLIDVVRDAFDAAERGEYDDDESDAACRCDTHSVLGDQDCTCGRHCSCSIAGPESCDVAAHRDVYEHIDDTPTTGDPLVFIACLANECDYLCAGEPVPTTPFRVHVELGPHGSIRSLVAA